MSVDWRSYLSVHMYLAPTDQKIVHYLMEQVPHDDDRTAKNLAVNSAVEQFVPCWLIGKFGTVYVGGQNDFHEFDYKKYDPRTDSIYAVEKEPNFEFTLVLQEKTRMLLFSSVEAYEGTVEQLIIMAIRILAFRLRLRDKDRPNSWMTDSPEGIFIPISFEVNILISRKEDSLN